jgi:hypothetical protein
MKKLLASLAFTLLLTGCATVSKPVPDGYTGPVVSLADTGVREDGSKGRFFAAVEIDGSPIQNALRESRMASSGQGFSLTTLYTTRDIPVRPMKVKLIATHQTAAPIQEIAGRVAGTFFSIDGTVAFSPTAGRRYEVTGELKKEKSCVWIADAESKAPVTEKTCTP